MHNSRHFGDLSTSDLTDFATVQGCDVSTAPTNSFLAVAHDLLASLYLWCSVRCVAPCEALANEGVDVDAEIDPAVADDHAIWDSCVHLVCHDALRAIAHHQPSSCLFKQVVVRTFTRNHDGDNLHCVCLARVALLRKALQRVRRLGRSGTSGQRSDLKLHLPSYESHRLCYESLLSSGQGLVGVRCAVTTD